MVPETEKPRVKIEVQIDCKGCVQMIEKALHGIKGISNIDVDMPQQKLTIIGCVDPEKIVRAIKKTRKLATICSPTEPSSGGCAPLPDPSNPPLEEPVPPPKPVEPPIEPTSKASGSKEAEEVHIALHYTLDHGHMSQRYGHDQVYNPSIDQHFSSSPSPRYKHESPHHVHMNLNYKHESQHIHYTWPAPPQHNYTQYNRIEPSPQYTGNNGEYSSSGHSKGNISSIFGDENPNACTIV